MQCYAAKFKVRQQLAKMNFPGSHFINSLLLQDSFGVQTKIYVYRNRTCSSVSIFLFEHFELHFAFLLLIGIEFSETVFLNC